MSVGGVAIAYLPTDGILVAFALVGVGNGLIDVYLNVAAQRAEGATGKPVLQWLHATYALGGITGASVAGALRAAGPRLPRGARVRGRRARGDRDLDVVGRPERNGTPKARRRSSRSPPCSGRRSSWCRR